VCSNAGECLYDQTSDAAYCRCFSSSIVGNACGFSLNDPSVNVTRPNADRSQNSSLVIVVPHSKATANTTAVLLGLDSTSLPANLSTIVVNCATTQSAQCSTALRVAPAPTTFSRNFTLLDNAGFIVELSVDGIPISELGQPVLVKFTLPSDFHQDPRLITLMYFDTTSQQWVDSSSLCSPPCPPRVTPGTPATIEFMIMHLTQFQGFIADAAATSAGQCVFSLRCNATGTYCSYRDADDGGGGLMDSCVCRAGTLGVECESAADLTPLRWTLFGLWAFVFCGALAYTIFWWCRAGADAVRGVRRYLLLLLIAGSATRVVWLGVDPYSLNRVMPPVADAVIGGLYFPLSLLLSVLVCRSFAVAIKYVRSSRVESSDNSSVFLFDRRWQNAFVIAASATFPIWIVGDVLWGVHTSDAARQVSGILSIVAVAMYVAITVLLLVVSYFLYRRLLCLHSKQSFSRLFTVMAAAVFALVAILALTIVQIVLFTGPARVPLEAPLQTIGELKLTPASTLVAWSQRRAAQEFAAFSATFFLLEIVFLAQATAVFAVVYLAPKQVRQFSSSDSSSATASGSSASFATSSE
jgi:hypothetical protein